MNGAAPGYDNATGLGSVNISNLVERWNAPTAPFASKTALKSSAQKIVPTSSVTLTATVASTGRGGMAVPAGKAQFYLDSTSGTFLGSASVLFRIVPAAAPMLRAVALRRSPCPARR